MKRVWVLFWSLFLIFLFSVETVAALDEDTLRRLGLSPEKIEQSVKEREEKKKQCSSFEDKFVEKVLYGKRITAFELCRKQGGSVDECIQKISSISETWKQECAEFIASDLKGFYLASLLIVNFIKAKNESLVDKAELAKKDPIERMFYLEALNKYFAQLQPGSTFSFTTGTGKVVFEGGEVHFQNWKWTQYSFMDDRGITIHVFPNRVDLTLARNSISFYLSKLEPQQFEWELIDFSLPFDMQTEQIFLTLNKGVRITEKEIIRLADNFLKNTAWSLNIMDVSKKLLVEHSTRRAFVESMIEFYAYDNYIKKAKAETTRQKKKEKPRSR
jgi:hypothetical protein